MPRVSDLVQDSKLETHFSPEYTVHIYNESSRTSREQTRVAQREEYWKREREIGGGSYGRVWLEQCVGGQREIVLRAVKQIAKPSFLSKPVDYNRELEAISKFSHWKYERCFVKSFGWYESPEAVFIAMEYCEHGDLHTYLVYSPPLPEVEAQQVTFQVLEGLSFMHDNGFSHRDIKPGNILVASKPPDNWWVKLGDFGISKRTDAGLGFASTVKGTIRFMAPELLGFFDAGDDTDPRNEQAADIWALGEIAFQMLTKEATFEPVHRLGAYVRNHVFPVGSLQARGISDDAIRFESLLDEASGVYKFESSDFCTNETAFIAHGIITAARECYSAISQVDNRVKTAP
ncbi:Spindle assembly checkpoint kinase [Lachnellula suecica]|uniref:Autophagy-related protein 1 n=1 Tax=Lachnellula suecica TaxID=602035 RepID=A0A8T9CA35_9HELO|nr:Spindle assembly checkpoint kinase [Lachnellula suecica]